MPFTQRKTRVVIVDDHPMVREGIATMIQASEQFKVVGEAAGQKEAMEVIGRVRPAVVTLDMSLKEGDGLSAAKEISTRFPEVGILMVSMYSEEVYGPRAAAVGASGYIMKEQAAEKIQEGMRIVASGGEYFSAVVHEKIKSTRRQGWKKGAGTIAALSNRELQVYQLIGQGVTTRGIAERLELSAKTIETYQKHLRDKLNLASGLQLKLHAIERAEQRAF